jgi:hypothetical protein
VLDAVDSAVFFPTPRHRGLVDIPASTRPASCCLCRHRPRLRAAAWRVRETLQARHPASTAGYRFYVNKVRRKRLRHSVHLALPREW